MKVQPMHHGRILELASYPIKGLSPVRHQSVPIGAGLGFPIDRIFAFAKSSSGFVQTDPKPMPKENFIVLAQHAELAGLATEYDHETHKLSARDRSGSFVTYDLNRGEDRKRMAIRLTELLGLSDEEAPIFVSADPHRFTDISVVSTTMMHAISFLNLETVRAFGRAISSEIDPARFRANILFDGWPAFHELDLVGKVIYVGGLPFRVLKRTRRCAATEVNPLSGERDLPVPYLLRKTYSHMDMGIYAEALAKGELKLGATLTSDHWRRADHPC